MLQENKKLKMVFTIKKNNLVSKSTKAVCGIQEREIVVKTEDVAATKARLRARGMFIVGTSEAGGRTRRIWFTPSVGL